MMEHKIFEIESGKWFVDIDSFGATVLYFGTKNKNYILSHKSVFDYENDPSYMGKIVGPYANRIAFCKFSLNGKEYLLDDNDNGNNLHSGSACFGNKTFSVVKHSKDSITLELNTEEEGGFPGEKHVSVTYTLSSGALKLDIECASTLSCPISIVSHMYFSLDDSSKDVYLTLPSDKYVSVDSSLIPLENNPVSVENTPYDFRKSTKIGDRNDGKYDNSFLLKDGEEIVAEGKSAVLKVISSQNAVQFYSGEFLSGDILPFSGFALETGAFPNSPNRIDFPLFIAEGEKVYKSSTTYILEEKNE